MKRFLIMVLVLLVSVGFCFAQEEGLEEMNGNHWNNFSGEQKITFVQGFLIGTLLSANCVGYILGMDKEQAEVVGKVLGFVYTYDSDLVNIIDNFYQHEQNLIFPIGNSIYMLWGEFLKSQEEENKEENTSKPSYSRDTLKLLDVKL